MIAKRAPYPAGCNFGINFSAASGIQVYLQDPNYSSYQVSSYSPLPTTGVFHHLAATYRQATSEQVEIKIFIDGQLLNTQTILGNLARTVNNAPVTIGSDNPNEDFFKGLIDEPSIYPRALSAAEIHSIYLAGSFGKRLANTVSPRMLAPAQASGLFQVRFSGPPNQTCTLQRAATLIGPWIPIGELTLDANGIGSYNDTNTTGNAFYRLMHR